MMIDNFLSTAAKIGTANARRAARQASEYPLKLDGPPHEAESTDLGPTVDDTNLADAQGWVSATGVLDDPLEDMRPAAHRRPQRPHRPLRRFSSEQITLAQDQTRLVTPSGFDTRDIERVTLSLDIGPGSLRVGATDSNAKAGGFAPPNQPLILESGPVYVAAAAGQCTFSVFVEWVQHCECGCNQ